MANCPHCQSENDADFGLVNCGSCGRSFLVEIDGAVRAPEATPPPLIENTKNEVREKTAIDELSQVLMQDLNLIENGPDDIEALMSPSPASSDMKELADYGNSEDSLAREGAYRFSIYISGIDSADIKNEIKDALSDGRFLWDLDALMKQIDQGALVIRDLSAVKSALIVQRLKILPIDIKWEQNAIHQP